MVLLKIEIRKKHNFLFFESSLFPEEQEVLLQEGLKFEKKSVVFNIFNEDE